MNPEYEIYYSSERDRMIAEMEDEELKDFLYTQIRTLDRLNGRRGFMVRGGGMGAVSGLIVDSGAILTGGISIIVAGEVVYSLSSTAPILNRDAARRIASDRGLYLPPALAAA